MDGSGEDVRNLTAPVVRKQLYFIMMNEFWIRQKEENVDTILLLPLFRLLL